MCYATRQCTLRCLRTRTSFRVLQMTDNSCPPKPPLKSLQQVLSDDIALVRPCSFHFFGCCCCCCIWVACHVVRKADAFSSCTDMVEAASAGGTA